MNPDALKLMENSAVKRIVEAAILAAGQPLSLLQLHGLFAENEPVASEAVGQALEELRADYADRGVELVEVASGFRFQVRTDVHPFVARLWTERQTKYSRALLETLSLIAYRQPITRAEIEQIRGVAVSSNIIRTLEEREWIRVVGHRDVPGKPALFGTTRQFLDDLGLESLDRLPVLLPTAHSALRPALERWFEGHQLQPRAVRRGQRHRRPRRLGQHELGLQRLHRRPHDARPRSPARAGRHVRAGAALQQPGEPAAIAGRRLVRPIARRGAGGQRGHKRQAAGEGQARAKATALARWRDRETKVAPRACRSRGSHGFRGSRGLKLGGRLTRGRKALAAIHQKDSCTTDDQGLRDHCRFQRRRWPIGLGRHLPPRGAPKPPWSCGGGPPNWPPGGGPPNWPPGGPPKPWSCGGPPNWPPGGWAPKPPPGGAPWGGGKAAGPWPSGAPGGGLKAGMASMAMVPPSGLTPPPWPGGE